MRFERMDDKQKKLKVMVKAQSDKVDAIIRDIHRARDAGFPNVITADTVKTHAEVLLLLAERLEIERTRYNILYEVYSYLFRESP